MAGFGFSPSDIIELGKFATKVTFALQDEGGSSSQYQEAINWCEDFQDVLQEIRNLELSNASKAFADKLEEQSQHTKEFVVGFKKKIAKYDKALGKNAEKGSQHGTARKIQWAMMAAADLDKFAQSLHLRIKSLEMFMASKTLANADQIPSLRVEAAKVSNSIVDLRRDVVRIASQQDIITSQFSSIYDEIRYLRSVGSPELATRVIDLTSMITQMLGCRMDVPLINGTPRVWTLPDVTDETTTKDQIVDRTLNGPCLADHRRLDGSSKTKPYSNLVSDKAIAKHAPRSDRLDTSRSDLAEDSEWIEGTNEVLRALHLSEIATDDFQNSNHRVESPQEQQSVASGVSRNDARTDGGNTFSTNRPNATPTGRRRGRSYGISTGLDSFSTAANIVGFAAMVMQTASTLSNITSVPESMRRVSGRLQDLVPLLEQVADVVATGENLRGGREILTRTRSLVAEIENKMNRVATVGKPQYMVAIRWTLRKDSIEGLLEEMELLKLTLSATLQAHAAKVQIQNQRAMVESLVRIEGLEQSVQRLSDLVQTTSKDTG